MTKLKFKSESGGIMGHDSEHPITIQREHLEAALPIVASILEHVGDAFNIEEGRHTAETYWDTAHMIRTALKVPTDARALESVDVPITAQFSQREIDFWRPDLISDPFGSEPDGDLKEAVKSLGTMGRLGPETVTYEVIKPLTPPKYYRPKEEPEPEKQDAAPIGAVQWSNPFPLSMVATMRLDESQTFSWKLAADADADCWRLFSYRGDPVPPTSMTWDPDQFLQAMFTTQGEMEEVYQEHCKRLVYLATKSDDQNARKARMAAILAEALLEHGTPD